nr:MAG TPA: hypothetical protein [Caudoviricetes sp.]
MYIIRVEFKNTVKNTSHILRDKKTRQILVFKTFDEAVQWCKDNHYELISKESAPVGSYVYEYIYRLKEEALAKGAVAGKNVSGNATILPCATYNPEFMEVE